MPGHIDLPAEFPPGSIRSFLQDPGQNFIAHPPHLPEGNANGSSLHGKTSPAFIDIRRQKTYSPAAGFHTERAGSIITHGLVAEESSKILRRVMAGQVGGFVRSLGKSRCVGFTKTIAGIAGNLPENFLRQGQFHPPGHRSGHKITAQFFHFPPGTGMAHHSPQAVRFSGGKAGNGHGDLNGLFLKKHHPFCLFQDRFQAGVKISDFFQSLVPGEKWLHHIAFDGSRPD